jgi:2-polyprenyl-3-methyl-5-hydroxy-6-metoxy-1,4-benzoquinol methylase
MKTISIVKCPTDGSIGRIKYSNVRDAYFGTPGNWSFRQNNKTGHLWLDPRPDDSSLTEIYKEYYTHSILNVDSSLGLWRQAISFALMRTLGYPQVIKTNVLGKLISYFPSVSDAAELEMMRIPFSETGRVLDVGCGGGSFLFRMQNAGWDVVGIEPDVNAAARLGGKSSIPIFSSLDELVNANGLKFDLIVLSHVVEHLSDPISMLLILRNLLKVDGRLVLTTPNARSLGLRLFGSSWRGLEAPRHFNIFSPTSITETLLRSGFFVVKIKTECRYAGSLWYISLLARCGGQRLETDNISRGRFLKSASHFYQIIEAVLLKIFPFVGEEIYCVSKVGVMKVNQDVDII